MDLPILTDFDQSSSVDAEFAMLRRIVAGSGRLLSFSLEQKHRDPGGFRHLLDLTDQAVADGLPIKAQVASPMRNRASSQEMRIRGTRAGFRAGDMPLQHVTISAGTADLADLAERWLRGVAPHDQGLRRGNIAAEVEVSLTRLHADYIGLCKMHRWDPPVPIE